MIYGTEEFDKFVIDSIQHEKRHPMYEKCCDHAKEMGIHVFGDKPIELLEKNRPREDDEVRDYRLDNYQPITKSACKKALSITSKIFNPALFNIHWKEQTTNGKKLQEYTLEYYEQYNSIIKFLSEAALKNMIADPNGIMTIRPKELPDSEIDSLEPIIKLYRSEAIWNYDSDHYLVHIREENPDDGKPAIHFFEYYDAAQIIDFSIQVINDKKAIIEEQFKYVHNFPATPVWYLSGEVEAEENGDVYYKSFFDAALPFWNLAITHDSDLFGAYINHLHPIKVELAEECDFVFDNFRCLHGKIKRGDGSLETCPSCKGTGYRSHAGPYGVYQVNREKLTGDNSGGLQPVSYVTVPTDATKMLEERIDRLLERGLYSLNMDVVNKVGENQSGVAKTIDRGELYDFLYKVSDVVFDTHLQNIYYFFNLYMFGVADSNPNRSVDNNLPEISKPVIFDISTVTEMLTDYENAKKSGANSAILREKQKQIASKEFATNPELKNKILLILDCDPLPELSVADSELLMQSNLISRQDSVIHFNLNKFIERALLETKGFSVMDNKEKYDILVKYADEFIKANKPKVDPSLMQKVQNPVANAA